MQQFLVLLPYQQLYNCSSNTITNTHNMTSNGKGSLIVVGTGIQAARHASIETVSYIENSNKVLYLVSDYVSELWIKKNNSAESLMGFYNEGEPRINAYLSMVDHILKFVKEGLSVCVIFYGHPGVFVFPSHEVIKQAKEIGILLVCYLVFQQKIVFLQI